MNQNELEHLKFAHEEYWNLTITHPGNYDHWEAKAEEVAAIISFYEPDWTP